MIKYKDTVQLEGSSAFIKKIIEVVKKLNEDPQYNFTFSTTRKHGKSVITIGSADVEHFLVL